MYFQLEPTRASDWDSVVTVHSNSSDYLATVPARTWHLHNHRIGNHQLISKFTNSGAKPSVSQCIVSITLYILGSHYKIFDI